MILVKTGKEVLNVPPYNALRSIADIISSGSNGAYHKLISAEAAAYLIINRDTAYSIRHGAYGKVTLVMAVMVVDILSPSRSMEATVKFLPAFFLRSHESCL